MSTHIDIRSKVISIIRDDSGRLTNRVSSPWLLNHAYSVNDRVRPTIYAGITFKCTTAGTSGATEPVWNTNAGDVTVDGTAVFTEDSDDIDRCILSGLDVLSLHFPDVVAVSMTGNGTGLYTVPVQWVAEFSVIVDIEYPINITPPSLMDKEMYYLYKDTTGTWKLKLFSMTPTASETFNFYLSIPRLSTSIPVSYIEAFCWLVSALCFNQLANAYVQVTESTINVDTVKYGALATNYADRAAMYMSMYQKYLGVNVNNMPSIAVTGRRTMTYPFGIERLTHPRIEKTSRTPFNTR